jgi:hypothetical protein
MSKRARVILTIAAPLVLMAGFVAWDYWPVALRYRQARTLQAGRATVRRYVNGEDSLGIAVCHLATELRRLNVLSMRLAAMEPGQVRRIVDEPLWVPSGVDPNDSKVQELTLNVYRISIPEAIPSADRIRIRQMDDSMIRARGFRIVGCAA